MWSWKATSESSWMGESFFTKTSHHIILQQILFNYQQRLIRGCLLNRQQLIKHAYASKYAQSDLSDLAKLILMLCNMFWGFSVFYLGRGFTGCLFSPLLGKMIQIGEYFSNGWLEHQFIIPFLHLAIWQVKRLFKAIIPKDSDAVTWMERMRGNVWESLCGSAKHPAPLRV